MLSHLASVLAEHGLYVPSLQSLWRNVGKPGGGGKEAETINDAEKLGPGPVSHPVP